MLVLSRKRGGQIRIGDDVVITICKIEGRSVRVGIEAPKEAAIFREELYQKIASGQKKEN